MQRVSVPSELSEDKIYCIDGAKYHYVGCNCYAKQLRPYFRFSPLQGQRKSAVIEVTMQGLLSRVFEVGEDEEIRCFND